MKTRLPFLLLSLALVALLAACGGGGNSGPVPADAVAQVGSTPITKASFNSLIALACANYAAQKQPCPKVGTTAYSSLRSQAVTFLVQQEELAQQASQKLGVTVTQQDIDKQLEKIKKSYPGGEKKFESALKQQGISLSDYELELRYHLLGQQAETKVAHEYYDQHKAAFKTPETREVRHILVKNKSLAEKLEREVKNGANFATLAKKYSKDPGSAAVGGKLCVAHGAQSGQCTPTVPPFDKAAFSVKTNDVTLVHSQFGWHVLQPISAIQPGGTQTFAQIKSQIEANQPPAQVTTSWDQWIAQMMSDFKNKVRYQTGYAPPATTTPTTPAATTG